MPEEGADPLELELGSTMWVLEEQPLNSRAISSPQAVALKCSFKWDFFLALISDYIYSFLKEVVDSR